VLGQDFIDLLQLFQQFGVRYLLVGGHAVSIYATPRYTKDLDLWVQRTPENASKILAALRAFGFGSLSLTETDFLTPEFVVQLGVEPMRIDLITDLIPLAFDACWERRLDIDLAGTPVTLIGIDDLIENKERAGRLRDLADAEDLRRRRG
jgi:predicted nucleotidyltransferase